MKPINKELIFVVEDDEIFAGTLKFRLNQMGYSNVKVFYNGRECIEHLYMNPKVILLDYMLEDTDGITVLKEVKSIHPDIHIIFLSGQETMQVAIDTLKYGAFDYHIKNDHVFESLEQSMDKAFRIIDLVKKTTSLKQLKRSFTTTLSLLVGLVFLLAIGVI